jgi:hypothetical protein
MPSVRRSTFKFDFEVVLYASPSILYSAQSYELFSVPENDFELNHNHLLKRIIVYLQEGMIPGLDLRYMREALHNPTTG